MLSSIEKCMQEILNIHRDPMIWITNDERCGFLHLDNDNDNSAAIVPAEEVEEQKTNLEMEEEMDYDNIASMQYTCDIEPCVAGACCKEKQGRFRCYY